MLRSPPDVRLRWRDLATGAVEQHGSTVYDSREIVLFGAAFARQAGVARHGTVKDRLSMQ